MPATGCYHLIFHLAHDTDLRIGALGVCHLRAGWYVYTGSAFGPGGLPARVARHRHPRRRHWHVDYLSSAAELVDVVLLPDTVRRECAHAAAVRSLPGAVVPIPRLGASDCGCEGHLAWFQTRPEALQHEGSKGTKRSKKG